ncbi:MAG: potassium transporter TrkH, partial [Alphaproteobacteria bacterium]|nr:potassium transporter TrkH [Alphaproteobacteria bacterium]
MIKVRPILFVLGLLLCTLAAAMVLPAIIDVADGNSGWQVFVASALLTFFIGGLLIVAAYEDAAVQLGVREGFLLTTLCWLLLTAFSAVPFVGLGLSYTDAFFEAMSGLTTTGSTVLVGLDQLPRGILLWRALLQGVGGLGIIAMAIIILPFLRVGGMQLFHAESSDRSEKVMPRALQLMMAIAGIYLLLLMACTSA